MHNKLCTTYVYKTYVEVHDLLNLDVMKNMILYT